MSDLSYRLSNHIVMYEPIRLSNFVEKLRRTVQRCLRLLDALSIAYHEVTSQL